MQRCNRPAGWASLKEEVGGGGSDMSHQAEEPLGRSAECFSHSEIKTKYFLLFKKNPISCTVFKIIQWG